MKCIYNITTLIGLSICLLSCSPELTDKINNDIPLNITTATEAFKSAKGTIITRTSENFYKTEFTNGDQIGITAVKNGTVYHGMDNVPFTYNATAKTWKSTNSSILPQLYYYPDVTYIAYYPYNASMNGKKREQEIIAAFTPQTDQSTYAQYTASDLMTSTGIVSGSNGTYTISFNLEHRMSLIIVKAKGKRCVTTSGYEYSTLPLDFSLKLNDTALQFYESGAGIHCFIANPTDASQKISVSFQSLPSIPVSYETTYTNLAAGKYYSLNFDNEGGIAINRDLQVGDYFYNDISIMPRETSDPPYKKYCIGLVFKVGRFAQDDSNYINGKGEAMTTINGYAVALKDANNGAAIKWGSKQFNGLSSNRNGSSPYGYFDGFKITQLLKADGIGNYQAANACINYLPASDALTSGWFFPAGGQMLELRNTRGELVKRTIFKNYNSGRYWQSTQNGSGDSWSVGLTNTGTTQSFISSSYYVRSIVAF